MNVIVISLLSAAQRRAFQQTQMDKLELDFEFLDATSIDDINETTYKKHAKDWQRPLKKTEIACYYSHQSAWEKVIQNNEPALILEDDALLSICTPKILADLANKKDSDLISLENRGRKKFVAKTGEDIVCESKLFRLYQDRTGAAGYVLYPSGAKKLLVCERKKGIALADAHITACYSIKAHQVEPSPIIQLDQCGDYGIKSPVQNTEVTHSTVSSANNPKGGFGFWVKRITFQLKLGFRQVALMTVSKRRYIAIRKQDF